MQIEIITASTVRASTKAAKVPEPKQKRKAITLPLRTFTKILVKIKSQKPAWLQGVAFKGHGQRKDKFGHQGPSCYERIDVKKDGIDDQKSQDKQLIPGGGGAHEI